MAMKRIDNTTVQRILDTANIVEVVSDFVSLKRRGANYIGLCPFHNERTPSFSVSPSKGICKCFSCGKGGSAVGFVMEHEQMTYNEALRYLAKKYNIEIKEHELSEAEKQQESERENMFAVNEFALQYFEKTMADTDDGRDIGLAYFRHRGISDASIKRFHLGYSLEHGNQLYTEARTRGYSEKALIDTGLCIRRDDGTVYDRFKGRVIYPVMTISGKVVAFGGRTLRNDKKVAKYVNSPESIIYKKNREVYGLYQAKKSIVEKQKCILVEGYMDVISMSQSGIENVVASSGTSLTEGQIRLIHRFTENVTVIYDSDPAGIKASLRGIDMLLAEGLNMKVVLLPDGDDPDSFAQSHSSAEVEQYIAQHETDFIRFKTEILLKGVENDPTKRAQVITEIVRSISVIPNEITQNVYIKECSRMLNISEKVLLNQMKKLITERREKEATDRLREEARASIGSLDDSQHPDESNPANESTGASSSASLPITERQQALYQHERELARYIIRYGMVELPTADPTDSTDSTINVLNYIINELRFAEITFSNQIFTKLVDVCQEISRDNWPSDFNEFQTEALRIRDREWSEGEQQIRSTATNLEQIKHDEKILLEKIDGAYFERIGEFTRNYLMRKLASLPDDSLRALTTDLGSSRHKLSKVHSKYTKIETEADRLADLLPRAVYGLKNAIIGCDIHDLNERFKQLNGSSDVAETARIMSKIQELTILRNQYAKSLGERVVIPK